MNNKGFTLAELLVAILILGIITGIAIPVIRNVQLNSQKKHFETYKTSFIYSSKLYTDSYGVDLFGKRRSGCSIIRYSDLKDKDLLKDINMKNITCGQNDATTGDSESFVRVNKYMNKYYYKAKIICRTKSNDSTLGLQVYPNLDSEEEIIQCKSDGEGSIDASANPESHSKFDTKEVSINVTLTSATGFSTSSLYKPEIEYYFTKNNTLTNDEKSLTWTNLSFGNIPKQSKQMEKISNAEDVYYKAHAIKTPKESGIMHLFIRTKTLYNLADEEWTPGSSWIKDGEYSYKELGEYAIDNTKPKVENIRLESNISDYNSLTPLLYSDASDDNTPTKDLMMCYSVDNEETCNASTRTDINKLYNKKYKSPIDVEVGKKYDGSKHKVTIRVVDKAGNISDKKTTGDYTIAQKYTLTFDSNGGKECQNKTITQQKGKAWGNLCTPTRTNYSFKEWNTKKDGTGTKITKDSKATKNITVYAEWKMNKPNKPTITNPYNGKWANKNFNLTIKTISSKNIVGEWYISTDNKTYSKYAAAKGKNSFTYLINTEREDTLYVKVCNKEATSSKDTTRCSNISSTDLKVDKTPPTCTVSGGSLKFTGTNGNEYYKWATTQTIKGKCEDSRSGVVKSNISKVFSFASGISGSYDGNYSPGECSNKAGLKTTCEKVKVRVTGTTPKDYVSGAIFIYDGKIGLSNTQWQDQSGNKRNVTLKSETKKSDNSIYCTGKEKLYDGYIIIDKLDYQAVTLETTFKPTIINTGEMDIVGNEEAGGYEITLKAGLKARFKAYKNKSEQHPTDVAVTKDIISYAAGSANDKMLKSYVNGTFNYIEKNGNLNAPIAGEKMIICGSPNFRTNQNKVDGWYFTGNVYAARMYSRVLNDDELQKHYLIDKARFGF